MPNDDFWEDESAINGAEKKERFDASLVFWILRRGDQPDVDTNDMRASTALYVGKEDAEYFDIKNALLNYVSKMSIATTLETAKAYLKDQNINLLILNLGLSQDKTREIVLEVRRARQRMMVIAVGRSFREVVEDNAWYIARGVDGTITVDQVKQAIDAFEAKRYAGLPHVIIGSFALLILIYLSASQASSVGKFIGALGTTVVAIEFIFYLVISKTDQLLTRRRRLR